MGCASTCITTGPVFWAPPPRSVCWLSASSSAKWAASWGEDNSCSFVSQTSHPNPSLGRVLNQTIFRLVAVFPSKVPVRTLLCGRARGCRSHHLPCGEHPFICEQQYVSHGGCVSVRWVVSLPCVFPQGVKLLSYLYNEAQNNCSNENYPVLLSLLKTSCEPYTRSVTAKKWSWKKTVWLVYRGSWDWVCFFVFFVFLLSSRRFVSDWVYSGVFRDVYGEFMIQVNEEYLGFRGETSHTLGYINRLVQSACSDNEKKAEC